ncbi:MAG: universal stress protein [Jatrophihabitantaceae bacterium]
MNRRSRSTVSRSIVTAIADQGALPVLEWVAALALTGDRIRIVHVYDPMPYTTVDWQLPVDDDALVYPAAARHTADAARRLKHARRDLRIEAEILRCAADRGLLQAAVGADLLIVGTPHNPASFGMLAHLSVSSPCPVLVVGDQHPPAVPSHAASTVMLHDRSSDQQLLAVAFADAAARRRDLIVLQPWRAPVGIGLVYAETEKQKQVDEMLIGWCERYPAVAVSVELRLGDTAAVLREHASDQAPLLMGVQADSDPTNLDPAVAQALRVRSGPILLVPLATAEDGPDAVDVPPGYPEPDAALPQTRAERPSAPLVPDPVGT